MFLAFAVVVSGCARTRDNEPSVVLSDPRAAPSASSALASPNIDSAFSLSLEPLHAVAGQLVLLPSPGSLRESLRREETWLRLVYTRAVVEEVGARASRVRWISQQRGAVANALIIPLPLNERARRGDIVFTSATTGIGVQRALVVSEGASETPKVLSLDEPPAASAVELTLEPGTFVTLKDEARAGVTLACSIDGRSAPFVLAGTSPDRVLAVGFAGLGRVFATSACRRLPLAPVLEAGAHVSIPIAGSFVPALVKEQDRERGRVLVSYEFAGEQRQASVGRVNVATGSVR